MAEVTKKFSLSLDIKRTTSNREFEVVEGDNGNIIEITLTDNGEPVDLTGCKVWAVFSHGGKTAQQGTDGNGVSIGGADNNVVTIALYTTSFSPGLVECEFQVYSGEKQRTLVTSAKFNFYCRRGIVNEDTIAATEEWPFLVEMLERVEAVEEELPILVEEVEELNRETTAAAGAANTAAANANATNAAVQAAEEERVAAETARQKAEKARVAAEKKRETFTYGVAAQAVTLSPGKDATAVVDASGGFPLFQFGIPRPRDGKDAVNVSVSGMYYLEIVDGDLHVVVPEDTPPPPLSIDENGDLIYTIE